MSQAEPPRYVVGIDVGGTFTDVIAWDEATGVRYAAKLPSTPDRPAQAMLAGLQQLEVRFGIAASTIGRIAHGTTVATNALIQHRGAMVALITTAGFRDVLEIGRQVRPQMFDLHLDPPPPLIPRERRFEVQERVTADGAIRLGLTQDEIDRVVGEVVACGADACAVCLLFSFRFPGHERRLRDALRAARPGLAVSISSDVHPEFREFERFSTTVINAFVQPVMAEYLTELAERIGAVSPATGLGINQSSGGLMSVSRATALPVRTALSGPAAGIVGALTVARASGDADFITLDMGGTSADVALIRGFQPELASSREIEGYPVRLPAMDINAVGAGGGSIAWLDRDGLLKVGPNSAGAEPGPACYGRGGTRATVTDANLYLGRLGAGGLLGGRMRLDRGAAEAVLQTLADALALSVPDLAMGIVRIVDSNMVRAIRFVSIERGHDPRTFTLIPFGGAGGLHALAVARSLGITRVVIPAGPGLLCAQGLIGADRRENFVRSVLLPLDGASLASLDPVLDELHAEAEAWFASEAVPAASRRMSLAIDMRYTGQNFELGVPAEGWPDTRPDVTELRTRFLALHERSYGFHSGDRPMEIVNLRLAATGLYPPVKAGESSAGADAEHPPGQRDVVYEKLGAVPTPVLWRESLPAGVPVQGPAVIEQMDATILLHPGDLATPDAAGNLVVRVGA